MHDAVKQHALPEVRGGPLKSVTGTLVVRDSQPVSVLLIPSPIARAGRAAAHARMLNSRTERIAYSTLAHAQLDCVQRSMS